MKKTLVYTAALLMFITQSVFSQTCVSSARNSWEWPSSKHWFVGDFPSTWSEKSYILDFNNSPFTVSRLGGGTFANGQYSYEGITSASNDKGELVYYSNGIKAWNSSGNDVSNSVGEGSEGYRNVGSAAQGIISVRHPLAPNKYYAVATNDVIGPNLATSYNIFDETGAEIQGNTFLPGGVVAAEGISATLHANGVDIWVSVQEIGTTFMHSWLLTCDGFITASVTSNVAKSVSGDKARGGISFSHDGKKLAAVFPVTGRAAVSVYDFDNKTGKFSGREDVGGGSGVLANGYDVVWSKDNSQLIIGNNFGNRVFRVDLGVTVLFTAYGAPINTNIFFIDGPDSQYHAVEIGPDGNYYFNGKDGLWKWTGSGAATKVGGAVGSSTAQGLPSIYIPPAEEPDIEEIPELCDTASPVDLHTYWVCSQLSAEDTLYQRHSYYLLDSNENIASNSGTVISEKTGAFSPSKAGVGTHKIVFVYCDVNDTIDITVNSCAVTVTGTGNVFNSANQVKIYPNPTDENLTVSIDNYTNLSGVTIKVLDALGTVVHQQSITGSTQSIDVNSWTAGVYFFHVMNGSKTVDIRKIVVNN